MVKIFTTKYQFLGRILLTLLLAVVSCVNAWADTMLNEEYKSGTETIRDDAKTHEHNEIYGRYTYTVYDDLIISGSGTVVIISGDLTLNGQLIVKEGATLIVEGNLSQNDDVEIDGGRVIVMKNWKSNSSLNRITVKEKKNSLFVSLGKYNNGAWLADTQILLVHDGTGGSTDEDFVYVPGAKSLYYKEGKASSAAENIVQEYASLLPITLNYFTAEQDGEEVVFEWQTSSEVNNDFFTIEYSIDGIHFKELLREDGNGTTSVTNDYYATASAEEFAGITYFRLKQTDFNGEYSYSDVIFVSIVSEETELYVFPNPTTDYVSVSGNVASAYVSDMYGRNMSCLQTSENTFAVAGLSVGTYYVVVSTKNGKKVLPFVKK